MTSCPFCTPEASRIFHDSDPAAYCTWDLFPVSPGHALVIPRRHVATWFDATRGEQASILDGIEIARAEIARLHSPAGYNIGINVGEAAGQTVPHLHVHVIPRYSGDVIDPRGGVRGVIPSKANYLASAEPATRDEASPRVVGSNSDPLAAHLLEDLARAQAVDVAVAFVFEAGLERVWPHLVEVLERNGRVRILTGDYLGTTEPAALRRLMDLERQIERRVFESAADAGFHSKLWILGLPDGRQVAYIGSSNLTRAALDRGVESNLRVDSVKEGSAVGAVAEDFERLFGHPNTVELTYDWIKNYEARRLRILQLEKQHVVPEPVAPPLPNEIQRAALVALNASRAQGERAGLVVMATGLGKTWLAAFDCLSFGRILFVAHREEILGQARETFRRIRPDSVLGYYNGEERATEADVTFASVQTLGKARHLESFARDAFDYIVVDEFHHAAAATYRRLIDHFEPAYLLGLTATPERTDGGDLLSLCDGNLVFRCDLADGIRQKLLSPFHYFGVPDEVDYENIPWRNARFDPEALDAAVVTQKRAANALEQWRKRGGERTLAFCVSKRHADFMQEYFRLAGVRCVSVHSGLSSAPRALSLEQLRNGELQVVFAVDMFNEGVDVPAIDTVMMLRPTESRIVWLQQLGRGLRVAEGKSHLNVIDYIGNHRSFLQKPIALLGLPEGAHHLKAALAALQEGTFELPPGCEVTYELQALDILNRLIRIPKTAEALRDWYEEFRVRFNQRPDATETMRAGFDPGSARKTYGSWLRFVDAMGDLGAAEKGAISEAGGFLDALETTPMTRSYKMLVLLATIGAGKFPGTISIDDLVAAVRHHAERSRLLRADVGTAIDSDEELRRLLEENPIAAWVGGAGTGDRAYFRYEKDELSTTIEVAQGHADAVSRLAREVAEWRLVRYLERKEAELEGASRIVAKVSHANGTPMLFLPDRDKNPGIPEGWQKIEADGKSFDANFVKVALNVVRPLGSEKNVLPELLTGWFGANAGAAGTHSQVIFERSDEGYTARPLGTLAATDVPKLWQSYMREEIPPLFGLTFNTAIWNKGFVWENEHIFLLCTLGKDGMPDEYHYANRFLDASRFQWQSQNQTKRESRVGRAIANHRFSSLAVHLFVRKAKKQGSKAAPFVYCGDVDFARWEGDQPITVEWTLNAEVPGELTSQLSVPLA